MKSKREESHREHSERVLGKYQASPCTALHVNYGGGCLNCGWEPEPKVQELEVDHHDHLHIVKN